MIALQPTDLYHVGLVVDDIAPAAELAMFAYYTDPAGVRVEIVDRALSPGWPGFLEMTKA